MAGYRSGGGIMQNYQGFSALTLFALKDSQTRIESISGRLNTYVHIFAYLNAKLPEMKIADDTQTDGKLTLQEVMDKIAAEIKTARETYSAAFEEERTYSDDENRFLQILDGILYRETEVIARTKFIDNERMTEFEVPAGTT